MMVEGKIAAVILFGFGALFLLLGIMVFPTLNRGMDNEEIIGSLVILLFNLILSSLFIIGGIQLWQI